MGACALPFTVSVAAQQSAVPVAESVTLGARFAAVSEREFAIGDFTVRIDEHGAAFWRRGDAAWRALRPVHDLLRFHAHAYDPVRAPFEWPGRLGAPAQTRLHLVQFHTQVLPVYRDALASTGVELLQVLPDNAVYVRGDAAALRRVATLPCVRWVGPLQNGFKLDAATRAFLVAGANGRTDGGVRAGDSGKVEGGGQVEGGDGARAVTWDCNLVLATKADRPALAKQVQEVGGTVVDLAIGSTMLRAKVTPEQLHQLLAGDLVVYADRDGVVGEDMDNARVQTGANYVETLGGYRGNGVRVEIAELFDESHPDFNNLPNRVLVRSIGALSHGHCTAGIVGGSGANNPAARGVMDECTMIDGGYYNTADHFSQLQGSVQAPWLAMQVTASWGGQQTTDYTTISQALDDALFHFDVPRTQSQSNSGTQASRPEAWAKNGISVGAVVHNDNADPSDDTWSGSASIGPAMDGRIKPDLVAYDDAILTSDRSGTAGYNPNPGVSGDYYAAFSGTSGATPIVNGCLGIVQEMFTDGLFGNPLVMPPSPANRFANRPHMTTARALLCNTATQYDFSGVTHDLTRNHQGWGVPSLSHLYDHRRDLVVLDEYDVLQFGDRRRYLVYVAPGTPELRVTTVWNDPAGNPAAGVQLVDDLDLVVTRWSDGEIWHGNHGLDVGTTSLRGGAVDTVDNVECVYLTAPLPGLYLVDVLAASILVDEHLETPQLDVDFALAMHPMGGGYCTPGRFDLDVSSTAPGDLHFSASNVPATGWTEGFTLLSFSVDRGCGFGAMFGLEPDALTGLVLGLPAVVGDAFHFVNAPGAWPFVPYQFPDPGLISALSGLTMDAVVVLMDGAEIAAVSDVERQNLQ